MTPVRETHSDGDSASSMTRPSRSFITARRGLMGGAVMDKPSVRIVNAEVENKQKLERRRPYQAFACTHTHVCDAYPHQVEVDVGAFAPYLPEERNGKDEDAGFPRRQRKLLILRVVIVSI